MSREPMRMVVVGAGGTGGWLCEGLARMLEYQAPGSMLTIVDGDFFEPKNRERQPFERPGNKAEVRAAALQPHVPATIVVPIPSFLVADDVVDVDEEGSSRARVSDVIGEDDIVFTVVDSHAVRAMVFNHAATVANIHVFSGGNDDALYGTVLHYHRAEGLDVTEHPSYRHHEFVDPPDRNPGELSCLERLELDGGTQLLAANMAVAAWLLARVHTVIFAGADDGAAEVHFDLGTGMARALDRRERVGADTPVG